MDDSELHKVLWLGMSCKAVWLVISQERKDELIKKYDIPEFIQKQIVVTERLEGKNKEGVS